MDSFLCLFDPSNDAGWDDDTDSATESDNRPHSQLSTNNELPAHLPPEPQLGNVEYKLKLVSPSRHRFEHLVTQMKWRLREGQGEAIYEIGVEDSGQMAGLSREDMEASLGTLRDMARRLDATTTVLRERVVEDGANGNFRQVAEVLVRKVPDDQHSIDVRVAVLGSADVGKSTLLGVLTQGELDNGRGRARLNMFRHLHEVQSGRTSSISHEVLGFDSQGRVINYSESSTTEEICENSTKLITLIDLAGHHKYLKTTIFGLTGYSPHYVMFVVNANVGVVGMSREHLGLAMALEVPLFVVVTKTDLAPTGLLRHTLDTLEAILKAPGCNKVPLRIANEDDVITAGSNQLKQNVVPIFCVSSVTGRGLDLLTKFLHVLPPAVSAKERERLEQQLSEFQIDETFRVPDVGTVVGGLLTQGVLAEGSSLMLGPFDDGRFAPVTVQSVRRNKTPCRLVRASQSASLGLSMADGGIMPRLRKGMVMLQPPTQTRACLYFQATIYVLFHSTAIFRGFQTTVHIGNVRQTAVIVGIMAAESIHTNDRASVLFRFLKRPEFIRLGSRVLFREGRTKGIGKVTQTFPMSAQVNPLLQPIPVTTPDEETDEEEVRWVGIDDSEGAEEEEEERVDEEEDDDSETMVNGIK